jgi:proline dehydrogenase
MLRAALLGAAEHRGLQRFVMTHGRRLGAYRFVAGESLEEFLPVVRALNARGMRVAAGMLGEDVRNVDDAARVASEYESILERFARERANANIALKLTHLGLAISPDLAFGHVAAVVRKAAQCGNFVRIDMEQSAYTDSTLDIYRRLRAEGHDNVGTVLQAYLQRTEGDLRSLLPSRPNLRLVKGAYLEPPSVAFSRKSDVDENLFRLIKLSLTDGGFTAIATHDETIIERSIEFIRSRSIGAERFEFQMLYGVRPRLQSGLLARGFGLRIAVPFGSRWYPYFMRRLAERPANLLFFLSSLWRG